jgi:hypothetical protein
MLKLDEGGGGGGTILFLSSIILSISTSNFFNLLELYEGSFLKKSDSREFLMHHAFPQFCFWARVMF